MSGSVGVDGVDTFPRGSFGELLSALDLCRKKAFVFRPAKAQVAARPDFQAMLPLYDLVLVPERAADATIVAPESVTDRIVYTGPILSREDDEVLPREEARAVLDAGDREAVLVPAGGGDPHADALLRAAIAALGEDSSKPHGHAKDAALELLRRVLAPEVMHRVDEAACAPAPF